jgi:transposase-like protein
MTEFFQYTKEIRRLIYTTNTVEGYHRQICKVMKNKGVFPSDTALEKLVYLAYRNISEKWTDECVGRGVQCKNQSIQDSI